MQITHLCTSEHNINFTVYIWQLRTEGYLYEVEVLRNDGEELFKEIVHGSFDEAECMAATLKFIAANS